MAAVSVIARISHSGRVIELPGPSAGCRPICDSCGYKGPRYALTDRAIAQVGLEAHIATAQGGPLPIYQIKCEGGFGHALFAWNWDWDSVAWQ